LSSLPIIAVVVVAASLGGCASARDLFGFKAAADPAAATARPPILARGTPVPAAAADVLANAPAGGQFDYRLPDGRSVLLVLGAIYQSGLQVPCRIGRTSRAGGPGDGSAAYPFCRDGNQWYAMPPVVVSGF
jgi:hypothetical protein